VPKVRYSLENQVCKIAVKLSQLFNAVLMDGDDIKLVKGKYALISAG
jgi:hypothetical protein